MFRFLLISSICCSALAEEAAVRSLAASDVLPAMQKALEGSNAEIEILEVSHFPAPVGEIEFSLKDLNPPAKPTGPTRWRGFVRLEVDRKFAIWAIVKITSERQRVVATERLEVGQPISMGQIREETYRGFPFAKNGWVATKDVIGRAPLRTLSVGHEVSPEVMSDPIIVSSGEELTAKFRVGRLSVRTPVISLGSARAGQRVAVRNIASKKILEARVDSPGLVIVETAQ